MGGLFGHIERLVLSKTGQVAFNASGGASVSQQLVADLAEFGPAILILRSDQPVRIRQGGSGIAATANDKRLKRNHYRKITVETEDQNYIAALGDGSDSGTLYFTLCNFIDTSTSGAAAIGEEP